MKLSMQLSSFIQIDQADQDIHFIRLKELKFLQVVSL